eukprot:3058777-Alexandrium_andersonii.AAC.1
MSCTTAPRIPCCMMQLCSALGHPILDARARAPCAWDWGALRTRTSSGPTCSSTRPPDTILNS